EMTTDQQLQDFWNERKNTYPDPNPTWPDDEQIALLNKQASWIVSFYEVKWPCRDPASTALKFCLWEPFHVMCNIDYMYNVSRKIAHEKLVGSLGKRVAINFHEENIDKLYWGYQFFATCMELPED